jgi:Rrf2 family protein
MARLPAGKSILGRDLAEAANIPPNYLSKILLTLRKAGYAEATRGQGGGYRLALTPAEIRLVDIVELFDGIRSRPGCLLGQNHPCTDENPCSAHAGWRQVRLAFLNYLESNTIADIAFSAPPKAKPRAARPARAS